MSNPQLENGFTKLANEIIEKFCKFRVSGEEWMVLWVILRKTYGFNKKEDAISLSQFAVMTDLKRPSIIRALKKLVTKKLLLIDKSATSLGNKYTFNKHFDTWVSFTKKLQGVTKELTIVDKKANEVVTKKLHTKETLTKEINKYPFQDGLIHWNKRKVWPSNVATPPNNTVLKKLLKECLKETPSLITAWKKISPTKEDWELAVGAYVREVASRNPNNEFSLHRFSLYEFIKQSNGYITYLNK